MAWSVGSRIKRAWNAFVSNEKERFPDVGYGYSYRPDRARFSRGNERSIVTAVYNRIAMDASAIDVRHVRLDDEDRFLEYIKSGLDNCLTIEANIDQTGRAFMQDVVMSMLDEGCVAIVPTDVDVDPDKTNSYDILELRTGRIVEWYPKHVRVDIYNEEKGLHEEILASKKYTAIVENPMYAVMNEPSSTLQRLIRKLNLLDAVDNQISSGKLDLILQLPYTVRSDVKRREAERRRKDIEDQLANSKYGIAYTEVTEKIVQLNRPIENNLMTQVEYLTNLLFSQLGVTTSILDGTADEETMLNYYSRTIEPILSAIVDAMKRTFLTKTAITQHQSIEFFRDPFKLVPIQQFAEIGDKMTRNEIMSSNELRQKMGLKPSADPKADQLLNKNLPQDQVMTEELPVEVDETESVEINQNDVFTYDTEEEYVNALEQFDKYSVELDKMEKDLDDSELTHYASKYYDPVKAHEYYMKNRELKGYEGRYGGTTSLNDAGKKAKAYVKKQIDTERKSKQQQVTDALSENIREWGVNKKKYNSVSKDRQKSEIAGYKDAKDTAVARNKESQKTELARLKADKATDDAGLKEQKDKFNESAKTAYEQAVEAEKERKNQRVENHKQQTEAAINSLKNSLSSMSKEDKAKNRESIQAEITSLRNKNTEERNALNEEFNRFKEQRKGEYTRAKEKNTEDYKTAKANRAQEYKTDTAKVRAETKSKNESEKTSYKEKSDKSRSDHKERVDRYKEEYQKTLESLREEAKTDKANIKTEYDKKYQAELEKILSDPAFKKTKKK